MSFHRQDIPLLNYNNEDNIVLVCYRPSPKFFEGVRDSVEFDRRYLGFCVCL